MENGRTVSVSYGLREVRGQRRIVHLEMERMRNSSENYTVCRLSFAIDGPVFKVSSADDAMRVLFMCPEEYNSSTTRPAWGCVDPDALEVVVITEIVEVDQVRMERPVLFNEPISVTAGAHAQCERLLGKALPPHYSWAVRVVGVPEGETIASLKQKCEGQFVFVGYVTNRQKEYCRYVLSDADGHAVLLTSTKEFD